MKKMVFFSVLSIFLFGFIKFKLDKQGNLAIIELKKKNVYGCSPDFTVNMKPEQMASLSPYCRDGEITPIPCQHEK